jgi:hypothetical protein
MSLQCNTNGLWIRLCLVHSLPDFRLLTPSLFKGDWLYPNALTSDVFQVCQWVNEVCIWRHVPILCSSLLFFFRNSIKVSSKPNATQCPPRMGTTSQPCLVTVGWPNLMWGTAQWQSWTISPLCAESNGRAQIDRRSCEQGNQASNRSHSMRNDFFWDVTPCSSYKNRLFGGT